MRSLICVCVCVCVLALLVPACAKAQGGSNGFMAVPVQVVQVESVQTVGGSNGSVAVYSAPAAFVYARPVVAVAAAPVRVVQAVFPCWAERRAARLARRSARAAAKSYAIRSSNCVICN